MTSNSHGQALIFRLDLMLCYHTFSTASAFLRFGPGRADLAATNELCGLRHLLSTSQNIICYSLELSCWHSLELQAELTYSVDLFY